VIDQLANEYAGQPVVFLEYNVDNAPTSRLDRWMAAFSGGTAYLPLVMVDSGQQIRNGYLDFYNVYRNMVNTALARPALAEIDAQWERIGNRVRFSVELTNLATTTLSASNGATLHAIVYQEAHISLTNRYVRTVVSTPITNLAPGAIATFTLETSDLSGVNWDQLRYLVLADYRPRRVSALPWPGATTSTLFPIADVVRGKTTLSGHSATRRTIRPRYPSPSTVPPTGGHPRCVAEFDECMLLIEARDSHGRKESVSHSYLRAAGRGGDLATRHRMGMV
jgi:hypothetical protein